MADDKRKSQLSTLFDDAMAISKEVSSQESSFIKELNDCEQRYTSLQFYKSGGSKVIYRAFDEMTKRTVALAQLKQDSQPHQVDSFLREARINALLQHPNIVPVYDIGLIQEKPFFCMKFIAGNSLEEIIEKLAAKDEETIRQFPRSALLDVFLKVCDAMSYAHKNNILHLDLKPDNIRIDHFGDVLICDWGLSAIIDETDHINDQFGSLEDYSIHKSHLKNMTLDGYIKGTPGYMAPEQTMASSEQKNVTSDSYALGALLYSLLTYQAPFQGDLEDILEQTAKGDFLLPSTVCHDIPAPLEAICIKAMSQLQSNRYQTVEALHKDILSYRNDYLTTAEEATFLKLISLFFKRNKLLSQVIILSTVLFLSSTAFFIVYLQQSKNEAVNLTQKLIEEKNESHRRGEILSAQFVEKYREAYLDYSFDDALIYINSALKVDMSNSQAWFYKARLHCLNFEFEKSVEAFQHTDDRDVLYDIAMKFKNDKNPMDAQFKLKVIQETMKTHGNSRPSSDFVHWQIYSNMELHERLVFVPGVLKLFNRKINKLNFKFYEKESYLDISNNKELHWAYALQCFPVQEMNLSNNKVFGLDFLSGIQLRLLNLSNTPVKKLLDLETEKLRDLNLSNTRITDLQHLAGSPIQNLDISHCTIYSFQPLKEMKYLKKLTLHKGQLTEEQLKFLPKGIEMILKD